MHACIYTHASTVHLFQDPPPDVFDTRQLTKDIWCVPLLQNGGCSGSQVYSCKKSINHMYIHAHSTLHTYMLYTCTCTCSCLRAGSVLQYTHVHVLCPHTHAHEINVCTCIYNVHMYMHSASTVHLSSPVLRIVSGDWLPVDIWVTCTMYTQNEVTA